MRQPTNQAPTTTTLSPRPQGKRVTLDESNISIVQQQRRRSAAEATNTTIGGRTTDSEKMSQVQPVESKDGSGSNKDKDTAVVVVPGSTEGGVKDENTESTSNIKLSDTNGSTTTAEKGEKDGTLMLNM